jgi:hypothetical protein
VFKSANGEEHVGGSILKLKFGAFQLYFIGLKFNIYLFIKKGEWENGVRVRWVDEKPAAVVVVGVSEKTEKA